jgi:hypothetical protein
VSYVRCTVVDVTGRFNKVLQEKLRDIEVIEVSHMTVTSGPLCVDVFLDVSECKYVSEFEVLILITGHNLKGLCIMS